jgi:hypothetical protein
MVSKHSELTKMQARDRYEKFTTPSRRTVPPPSCQEVASSSCHCTAPPPSRMQEVGSSSRRHTTPPPSRQEEASSDDSVVEMWVVPPPPLTRLEEASSDVSSSASSGCNDECPHIKVVSSSELLLDFNCLVQLLNVQVHFQIQKLEKKLSLAMKELQ